MPYISPEPNREEIDPNLTDALFSSIESVGDLDYVVTRLALRLIMRHGVDFANIAGVIGALHLIPGEIERRFIFDYENLKLEKNGDIPEFVEILSWLREQERKNTYHAPDTLQPHG